MALSEEKVWLGISKTGKGIVLTMEDGQTRYTGNHELLKKVIAGEKKGCPLSKIIPDKEDLMDAIMSHQQMNPAMTEESGELSSMVSGLFGQMMEFDMEMWISEDTFLLKKTTIAGDIDLAVLAGFKMSIEMEIKDIIYDEPVSIELPVEVH